MTGIFMESIIIAFMVGGIVGAITALHLSSAKIFKTPIKEKNRHYPGQG